MVRPLSELEKVLVLGGSFSAIPMIESLENYDLEIWVCGANEMEPGHHRGHQSAFIDYSNFEEVLALCKKEKFSYVIPTSNDTAYNTAVRLSNYLGFIGLDSLDVANTIQNKMLFRNFMSKLSFKTPRFWTESNSSESLSALKEHNLIVKPSDSFSGRGITKVNSELELSRAIKVAKGHSKSNEIVIEEFIEGSLYSHSAFIANRKITQDFFVEETGKQYPFHVDYSHFPAVLAKKQMKKMRELIEQICTSLKLVDGLLHTQFILSRGEIYIVETMRRSPGDLYGLLIEYGMGYKYYEKYVSSFINRETVSKIETRKSRKIIRMTVTKSDRYLFQGFKPLAKRKLIAFYPLATTGSWIAHAPFGKAGIAFYSENSLVTLLNKVRPGRPHHSLSEVR